MIPCRTWAKLKTQSTTQVYYIYIYKIFFGILSGYLADICLNVAQSQRGITCLLLHCSSSCLVMSPLQKVGGRAWPSAARRILLVKSPHCCVNRNSWCDWYTWRSGSASVGQNKEFVVTNTAGRVNGPDPDLEERRGGGGTPGAKYFFRVNISLNVDQFLCYTWE